MPGQSWEEKNTSSSSFPWRLITLPLFVIILFKLIRRVFNKGAVPAAMLPLDLSPREAADAFASGPPPLPQRFSFRLTDSGFYISGPSEAVGTQIEYTADVDSRVITDLIVFSPGPEGQFIFTGSKPRAVSVRSTGGQLGTTGNMLSASDDDDFHRDWRRSSSSTQSSYPSAY